MSFEVASVKQNLSGDNGIRFGMQPGGRFNAVNAPTRELLRFAYMVQNFQIVDAPSWAEDDRYDIVAKAEGDMPPAPPGQLGPMQMMMRSLLADRFKLIAREETREMPMYMLVLDRPNGQLGPQIKASTTDCQALAAAARRGGGPPAGLGAPGERPQCGMRFGFGELRAGSASIGDLARLLSGQLDRFVVDRTGLTGSYDFDLTFTPDRMPQGGPPAGAGQVPTVDPNGPSIFTALQEQLGLKLEATRGPVPVLVVERLERPTPD
jgi:uncharacterized protein (TIGR03435 family)